jgi:threonine synthase
MKYISTRGSDKDGLSSSLTILKGIADDGGLFVPVSFPKVNREEIEELVELEYFERAGKILAKFLTDIPENELFDMCKLAYDKFDGEPAPVVKIDDDMYVLELWHGPTLAFKDFALALLPYLLTACRKMNGSEDKTLILVATSGDTGKAALEGFKDVENTHIVVVYPSDGVSDMQKLQMQTAQGKNVNIIAIDGNFDDAQTAVKTIFNDLSLKKEFAEMGFSLSSANSINFGRLAPQIAYYFSAYADLLGAEEIKFGDKVNFAVPTGNFGNVLAAHYAKQMGLPIGKLIVASNQNNVLSEFFNTGRYDINRKFYKTMSPSMDILISSNLERLLFEANGRCPQTTKSLMNELKEYGSYELDVEFIENKFKNFVGYFADEADTAETIDNFFDMFGYLLDPHTAVAAQAYYNYVADTEDETKTVVVSTANPYKFPQDVYKCLTDKTELDAQKAIENLAKYSGEDAPSGVNELFELPILHSTAISKNEIKETILQILQSKI